MLTFERLEVWKKAILYARDQVGIADMLPSKYQYSFADQLRRAALSIPGNIAEGVGRKSKRDSVNILKLLEKIEVEALRKYNLESLYLRAEEIVRMLYGLSK